MKSKDQAASSHSLFSFPQGLQKNTLNQFLITTNSGRDLKKIEIC